MANELDEFSDFRENSQLYLDLIKESFQGQEIISNARFDQVFYQKLRRVSSVHWTPVEVVQSILELLDLGEGSKVLDVGSGAGKFCLLGWCSLFESTFYWSRAASVSRENG